MKPNIFIAIACAAVLQGCATSGKPVNLADTLKVYPDNSFAYILSNAGQSTRVWSDGSVVMALQFGQRLINVKDLDFVEFLDSKDSRAPLRVFVKLKSGETLDANVNSFDPPHYGTTVQWLACSKDKKACESVVATGYGSRYFPSYHHMFTAISSYDIASLARNPKALPENVVPNNAGESDLKYLLPPYVAYNEIKFGEVKDVSDISAWAKGIFDKERARLNCRAEEAARDERDYQATRNKYIKENVKGSPTQRDLAMLAQMDMRYQSQHNNPFSSSPCDQR